ncbi:MAG: hypothetical protein ACLFVG_08550 [Candidatus Aminicenantes bacterium]
MDIEDGQTPLKAMDLALIRKLLHPQTSGRRLIRNEFMIDIFPVLTANGNGSK